MLFFKLDNWTFFMNIEKLAETYTYNGVVSLKAIEDDIVTLENHIESLNETLNEIRLRGINPTNFTATYVIGEIRASKLRLSSLKVLYKMESNKSTPNDVILNVLGVSAKNANEVNKVVSAADGRKPKPQNFESAELEKSIEDAMVSVKRSENGKIDDIATVITQEHNTVVLTNIIQSNEMDKKINEVNSGTISENIIDSEDTVVLKTETSQKVDRDKQIVTGPVGEWDDTKKSITFKTPFLSPKDRNGMVYSEIIFEGALEDFNKNISEKTNIPEITHHNRHEFITTKLEKTKSDSMKKIVESKNEIIEKLDVAPPLTIDDYYEPYEAKLVQNYEESPYIKNDSLHNYQNESLSEILDSTPNNPNEWITETPNETIVPKEDSTNVYYEECKAKVYDPFYQYDNKIYVSFDLCDYTDMVNTDSITGTFNNKKKTLELTFSDTRDYSHLLFFLNEKNNNKCSFFSRFRKKHKSIIMYVRTEIDGVKNEYRYEFAGCRLIEVFDSQYKSLRESTYYPTSTHEFYAKFKYKNLKIG